uniref:MATH domain-containing protein n=1 Tax=Panagrolaimus sp. ES5 TaxID=591445 RepID=A0AC34G2P1_9BILA
MEYPIEMKWSINAENLNIPFTERLESKIIETTIRNVSFVACLYPNGKDEKGFVHLFIFIITDVPVDVKLTVSIPSMNFTHRYEKAVKESDKCFYGCGSNLFNSDRLLNNVTNYIENGKLTIRFFGTLKTQSRK